ncbi:uncharacterized protein PHALS_14299 [Plasmopara halstedii]|uniref:Uncharacterized protein n=1 Tax=Plasmopara halstedii TaxID=4781 RepID=A0A0P1ARU3_PLAHL|nr:uncharacterized protein PHALS_14299 [Plasmopara halstedii]CEG44029.1 hypothetical protein PHALS_14299 [Plasmopara halstedii]|eukprot:XP_024580398.1 hypothetical protein PHALS_14299 [Plasmopara halstedii]
MYETSLLIKNLALLLVPHNHWSSLNSVWSLRLNLPIETKLALTVLTENLHGG